MLNRLSFLATRAGQRILGARNEDLPEDEHEERIIVDENDNAPDTQLSGSSSSSVDSGDEGLHGAVESQSFAEHQTHMTDLLHSYGIDTTIAQQHYSHSASPPYSESFQSEDLEFPPEFQIGEDLPAYSALPTPSGPLSISDEEHAFFGELEHEQEAEPQGEFGEGAADVDPDAEPQGQQVQNHQDPRFPPPYVPSHLDQELARSGASLDDGLYDASGASSASASYAPESGHSGHISRDEGETNETPANGALTQSHETSDGPAEEEKEYQGPKTSSHTRTSDVLVNSGQADKGYKETDQALEPTLAWPITPVRETGEVPPLDKGGPSRPRFPESGQQTSSTSLSATTSQSPQRRPERLFAVADPDDAHFAPFTGDGAPRPGESRTETIIRDQIRRCEAIRGQPLSDSDKQVIRSYHEEMDRRRAPEDISEPTAVGSAAEPAEGKGPTGSGDVSNVSGSNSRDVDREALSSSAQGPWVPQSTNDASIKHLHAESAGLLRTVEGLEARLNDAEGRLKETEGQLQKANEQRALDQQLLGSTHIRSVGLLEKIGGLETRLGRADDQRASDQRLLDTAKTDIAHMRLDRQAAEVKLEALEEELQGVKAKLDGLEAHTTRAGAKAEAEAGGDDPNPRAIQDAQPPAREPLQAPWPGLTFVMIAMVALVWLVTEAMLHSKRLSDGYGPFINGGYNGLGSVVIFGTWLKFFLFILTTTYLGVVSVFGALTR